MAVAMCSRSVERARGFRRDPVAEIRADHQPVDHDLDIVLDVLVERWHGIDIVQGAVDLHAREAALLKVLELLPVFALAAADDGGEEV